MNKIKLNTKLLLENLTYGKTYSSNIQEIEFVKEEFIDKGRWFYHKKYIFKYQDKLWETFLEFPATEYQEVDYDKETECFEVEEKTKVVADYVRKQ